jgi:hypothetical protein
MARIYVVKKKETGEEHLVEANTPSQSIMHIAQNSYEAKAAKPTDVARLMGQGVKVEVAGADAETPAGAETA